MNQIKLTIEFLSAVLAAADMQGHRGQLDTFADRLVKAASEATLSAALEHLLRAVNASTDSIHPPLAARMLAIANSTEGPRILRWWREQAKLVTLLAGTRDQTVVDEALAGMTLPTAEVAGTAVPRSAYPITLRARCESPLSHGSDKKAGNATLFRRMQVLTDGGTLTLPYYAGNALRGQMRDLLADHFLTTIGLKVSRNHPVVSLWFFYALYSGGALEENSDATKALKRQLGDNGAIRATGIREFREMLPALSLLAKSHVELGTQTYSFGVAICQVDHVPAHYSQCLPSGQDYWALFVSSGGTPWTSPSAGVSDITVQPGDSPGLRYDPPTGTAAPPPPPSRA